MSLEAYTGKIKDLVITNPTPTDPKSQGDDHLRGIKKTMVDDAVRVSGSPLQQMGDKATAGENHYWDASTANQLSLKRGTPVEPGAELIKALNGVLSFPSQAQSLIVSGFVDLPGGFIIQWGRTGASDGVNLFTKAFPNDCLCLVVTPSIALGVTNSAIISTAEILNASQFSYTSRYWDSGAGAWGVSGNNSMWIAIGH